MTYIKPAEVFPPGEFIEDELEARGWTQRDLAEIIGIAPSTLNLIVTGKRAITPEMAKAIGGAFGTPPEFWLNLENAYQLSKVSSRDASIPDRARLYSVAPVGEMIRRGWISNVNTAAAMEIELKRFFGTEDLSAIRPLAMAARKSTSYDETTIPQRAWGYRVLKLGQTVSAGAFDEKQVARDLPKLVALSPYPENIRKLPAILASWGIRLVVVAHLERTKLDGATLWLDSAKTQPVVALSLRFDRIDSFWFTLMHEMLHVRNREVSIDADLLEDAKGEGGEPTENDEMENRVNVEAATILVPKDKLDSFIIRTRPLYSKAKVENFARLYNVHPGVVLGQLHRRREIDWKYMRDLLVQNGVRKMIAGQAMTDGWGHQAGSF
jgi:HTH-type transcriptional regulator/antitoxin HigA